MALLKWFGDHWLFTGLMIVFIIVMVVKRDAMAKFCAKLRVFYHEVVAEMKRVAWPSKDHVVSSTVLVGITTLVMMFYIGAADWLLGMLMQATYFSTN